jgi:hypothetical protein
VGVTLQPDDDVVACGVGSGNFALVARIVP